MRTAIAFIASIALTTSVCAAPFDYQKFDPANPAASGYTVIFEDQFSDQSKFNYNDPQCLNTPRNWWWHTTWGIGVCEAVGATPPNPEPQDYRATTDEVLYKTGVSGAVGGTAIELHFEKGTRGAMSSLTVKQPGGYGTAALTSGVNGTGYFNPGWYIELRGKWNPYKSGWGGCEDGNGILCWAGIWAMPVEWAFERVGVTPDIRWRGKFPYINRFVENDIAEHMFITPEYRTHATFSMNDRYGICCSWNNFEIDSGTWANGVATINLQPGSGAFPSLPTSVVINERYSIINPNRTSWEGTYKVLDATQSVVKLEMPNNPGGPTGKINLINVTWAAGTATFTYQSDYQLTENSWITIAGVTPSDYNGTYQAKNVTSNTFTVTTWSDPSIPSGSGGHVSTGRLYSEPINGRTLEFWTSNSGGPNIQELGRLIPGLDYNQWHVVGQLWVPGDETNGNRGFVQTYIDGKPQARFDWVRDATSGAPPNPPYFNAIMDDHHYFLILQTGADWIGTTPLTGASWAGGSATFTYRSDYPVSEGEKIRIAGVTPAGYNGEFDVVSTSAGSVTVAMSDPGSPTGTGGTINVNGGHASYDYLKVWQRVP